MKSNDSPTKSIGLVAKIKYMKPDYTTSQVSDESEDLFESEDALEERKIDKEFKAYQKRKRAKENK